jgi:hypothetical protein
VQDAVRARADGSGGAEVVVLQEFAVEVVLLDAVAGQVREPDGAAVELQVLVPVGAGQERCDGRRRATDAGGLGGYGAEGQD